MARTANTWNKSPGIGAYLSVANLCRTLSPSEVRDALEKSGKGTQRRRDLPAEAVVYYVIAMALFMHVNLREVLYCLMEGLRMIGGVQLKVTGKSGISQARTRIGAEPLRRLYEQHVQPVAAPDTKGAWYRDKRLVSLDGSTLDIPDEPLNRKMFGGPTTFNEMSPFPQIRFVCLAEIGTHVLFAGKMADYKTNEVRLAHNVISRLTPEMLCLADRGFASYALWKQAIATGADLLWRTRVDILLPVEHLLPDGSYLSHLFTYRSKRLHEAPLPVRVIEYRIEGVKGCEEVTYRLITTLLDHALYPAEELAALYQQRWEIETAFDELKTHLRGGRLCLRSKTPELIRQEFYGLMLAHFVVRGLMYEAAHKAQIDPDVVSFTHSLRVIRRKLPLLPAISP